MSRRPTPEFRREARCRPGHVSPLGALCEARSGPESAGASRDRPRRGILMVFVRPTFPLDAAAPGISSTGNARPAGSDPGGTAPQRRSTTPPAQPGRPSEGRAFPGCRRLIHRVGEAHVRTPVAKSVRRTSSWPRIAPMNSASTRQSCPVGSDSTARNAPRRRGERETRCVEVHADGPGRPKRCAPFGPPTRRARSRTWCTRPGNSAVMATKSGTS